MAATRRVSTRVAIEGDSEYRQQLSQIGSEVRKLESAMRLAESEFKNNANSMDALTAKSRALNDLQQAQVQKVKTLSEAYENAQASIKTYSENKDDLTRRIEENEAALERLKNTEGDTAEEQARLTEETKRLQEELANNEGRLLAAEKGANGYEASLNKAQIQLNETNAAIQLNDQYLDEAANSADNCATSIDQFGNQVGQTKDGIDGLAQAFAAAGIAVTLKKIADGFADCAQASIEFESAMTGVAKTTDLTDEQLADMAVSLQKMSTEIPQTANDLASIAENAGQLGIAQENLLSFTRVMADLGVATNLSGEEAAQTFAKFANITGMAQTDFDRLGSAIVDLGNNLATTEADIANMAMRLAAAGTQAGMSEGDILGLAGALSSVGLEAQAGGSAFSKAINMISVAVETGNDNLTEFATIAGMSAEQFARAYEEDAAGALVSFISGLGDMESHGKSATVLLEELGLTELRLRDSLTRAANASDLFGDSIARGNSAWSENTALTKEAELRYGTTESKLTILSNAFTNLKVAIGNQLSPSVGRLADGFTKLLGGVTEFIDNNRSIVPLITAAGVAFGILAGALAVYTIGSKLATLATAAFTAALNTNPVFLAITAIAALAAGIAVLVTTLDDGSAHLREIEDAARDAVDAMDDITQSVTDSTAQTEANAAVVDRYIDELEELGAKSQMTTEEQKRYALIVDELNRLMPELNVAIDEQTGLIVGSTEALRDNSQALKEKHIASLRQEGLTDLWTEEYNALTALTDAERAAAQATAAYEAAIGEVEQTEARMGELREAAIAQYNALSDSEKRLKDETYFLTDEYYELENSLLLLNDTAELADYQMLQANDTLETSQGLYEDATDKVKDYEEETARLTDSIKANADETENWSGAEKHMAESVQGLTAELQALEVAYQAAYDKAYETISGQVGLFDTFEHKAEMSTAKMTEIWDEQAKNVENYAANIAFASQYLNDDLIDAWSDGTSESAGYIQGFTDELQALIDKHGAESDEVQTFVDNFNASYEGTTAAQETWATVVGAIDSDYQASMDSIEERMALLPETMTMTEQSAVAANDTVQGYIDGFNSRMDEMYAIGAALAEAQNRGYRDNADQHSPSRRAMRTAQDTVRGYEIPFEESVAKFEVLGADMAQAVDDGYIEGVETQIALAHAAINNAQTATYEGGTVTNHGELTINVQKLTDAELHRAADFINNLFGGKMTVGAG